ncbi:MAG TPA: class I SAM-dependent methyltransferase [Thermodesulfobacteriota bacterium]|nr:class I SAM-dependent methyltransferase [Deltaproteobacteria bacterium]HNR13735.1 class I SAM-dependent methyltransferase [Thermodesulfobacteriota bacterium]
MRVFPNRIIVLFLGYILSIGDCACTDTHSPNPRFEPTPQKAVESMLRTAEVNPNDVVYDLGCGDGRFVITAAHQFGARAVGVDIDPARIKECTENAKKSGVEPQVTFFQADLFDVDLHEATVVTLFLLPKMNLELRPKLLRELKPGSRIVSYVHTMKHWKPDKTGDCDGRPYYCWTVPAQVSGSWYWESSLAANRHPDNVLSLEQHYQEISGSITINGTKIPLRNAEIEGDRLSFSVLLPKHEEPTAVRFQGKVAGNVIVGSLRYSSQSAKSTQAWMARR